MGVTVELGSLALTDVDAFGVRWTTSKISGWFDSAAATVALSQKPRRNGAWVGPGSVAPLEPSLSGVFEAPDEDAAADAMERLNVAATAYADTLLAITRGTTRRTSQVRLDGIVAYDDVNGETSFAWSIPLVAADPLKYGAAITRSTGPAASSGGLTWPVTWPIEWDSVVSSGTIHIDNPGKVESALIARIDGPCSGPRIRRVVDGVEVLFALDYALSAGSYLIVDFANQTVLEGDSGAARMTFIAADGFFGLAPGANDFVFTADDTGGLLTLTASPAYA